MRIELFNIHSPRIKKGAFNALIEEMEITPHHYLRVFEDEAVLSEITELSSDLRKEYEGMFVVGIGGSSQGARSIYSLSGSKDRSLVFLDDVDPDVEPIFVPGDLDSFCITTISKSGKTLETLVQLANAIQTYKAHGIAWKERIIFIVGNGNGTLQSLCDSLGAKRLTIPDSIPGRFSVFSAVGLLPVTFSGADVDGFIRGAKRSLDELLSGGLDSMHARLAATIYGSMETGRSIMVNAVYSVNLMDLSWWLSQLVAESLGKDGKGITPAVFKGPPLQHSQLQLYREGPDDKFYVFYRKENYTGLASLGVSGLMGFEFLSGKTLGDILLGEEEGTRRSLEKIGRPIVLFAFDGPAEEDAGYFMHMWMATVAMAGKAMGVNPYTQDGVDEGKRISLEILRGMGYGR